MPVLDWLGKDKVINHHRAVPFHFLDKKFSVGNSQNKIIHGDNLLALKSLLLEFAGKVKCIYIDPPYNTGNEGWIYNDAVNDPQIRRWLGQVVGKEGEDFTRHDKWLCMMYPRLRLLQKLLADDGAIFISIDDNEQANLKLICDEIFGAQNFVANIAVINNLKGRSDDKFIATAHENLLIYRKEKFLTNGVPIPDEYVKEYKLEDERGKYRLQGLRKRGANSLREDRPNMFYPFFYDEKNGVLSVDKLPDSLEILPHLSDGSEGRWRWGKDTARERLDELTVQKVKGRGNTIEILPHLSDGSDGCWRWGKDTARERLDELTVQKVKGRGEYDVFQKDYLPTNGTRRVKPKSFWSGAEFSAEAGTLTLKSIMGKGVFSTPKPVGIVEYILQQATDKDLLILDSFAGSGTTAHAVLNLNAADGGNRRFILIELMDYAESITAERVKRVGGSFDFYELGAPLFDEAGCINNRVTLEQLRDYIYFSETGKHYQPTAEENLLGVDDGIAYYLFQGRELNYDLLATIGTRATAYVIYADSCTLSENFLDKHAITFKKLPRDVRRY